MKITTKQLGQALYEALQAASAEQHQAIIKNFVWLIGELRLTSRAEKIITDFTACYNQAEGIEPVTVESARPLSAAEATDVTQYLTETLGKKIELTQRLEPGLIGGWRLRYADTVVDSSIQARLRQLRAEITVNN